MQFHLLSFLKPYSTIYRFLNVIIILIFTVIIYLSISIFRLQTADRLNAHFFPLDNSYAPTSINEIVFGIGSSTKSWPNRREYVKLWWRPQRMRGCVFLESPLQKNGTEAHVLPPICISEDTSRFRYTCKGGLRSAIRIARIVVETVRLYNTSDGIKWFVFGDDDTIFFPDNLAKTLSKYDHRLWYYVGSNSEIYEQDRFFGFDMAFGGGGLALSYPLAKTLAKVFDSCIERYPHVYGGDSRIYACLLELGVGLSHEPGFHQLDVRGNALGLLTAHPMAPLVSLHHMEHLDPIFPNTNTLSALHRLFRAADIDPARTLQFCVCYDRWFSWTISVSWGYAVQVHSRHELLPDILPAQETFRPWKPNRNAQSGLYSFNTRQSHPDPCRRPVTFFMENVSSDLDGTIRSDYKKFYQNCSYDAVSPMRLEAITVYSRKLDLDLRQMKAPRRQCCDILPSSTRETLQISIRECSGEELIYMHP